MDLSRTYDRAKARLNDLLLSEGLRAKALFGGAWLGGASVAEQAVRFARNMVLARLLAPSAFGTMAIVLSSSSLVDTLTDVGVRGAIVQNPRGGEEGYLNAAWWLGIGRALGTYILIFALAPWIAGFYGHPELSSLLRVALLSILLNAAMSPRSILPQREMKFGRWVAISNGGGMCGVILTVVLSFFIRDVWALAFGYLGENAFRCLFSYIVCPGLPSLKWDWHASKDLLTFTRGIFGLSFLSLIIGRADVFVLGRLYSSTALGLYTMAVALIMTPLSFLTNLLGQILFPALARVQQDTHRLNRIVLELTSWFMLLGLPALVSICLFAPRLLKLVYGARYAAAAGPLSVACAVVFITVLNCPFTTALFAKGRPGLHRVAMIISAIVIVSAIYPACKYLGTSGGQVAALLAVLAGYLFQLTRMHTLTGLNLRSYGKLFVQPVLASGGIVAIVLFARQLGLATRPAADVAICVGACLLAYAICGAPFIRTLRAREPQRVSLPESLVSQ